MRNESFRRPSLEQIEALVPATLRGRELKRVIITSVELSDGDAAIAVARDSNGEDHLVGVVPVADDALPVKMLLQQARERALYVDPEQTLPVFVDRAGVLRVEMEKHLAKQVRAHALRMLSLARDGAAAFMRAGGERGDSRRRS